MFLAFNRNNKIPVAIARYHNIYGPEGTWDGGKEKAPAAICRKVIQAKDSIEIWGDGEQTRSFLYIDECIEATRRLMESNFVGPVNIGSEEIVTINELVEIACSIEGKVLSRKHVTGPVGVRGRNSNNDLVKQELKWDYFMTLREGIEKTYFWIKNQTEKNHNYYNFLDKTRSETTI
jgi:nucleoside-diphosphate-sugar epimerase